ncbi:MAG: hypothetical protein U9Q12_03565, partial [Patescibacteria group bacterium]|nr:hypothetical protein [Patescibacteria group bacterium]
MVYAVQLLDEQNNVLYEKIYDDGVTVAPQSTVQKQISFQMPSQLSGMLTMQLVGHDERGMLLEEYIVDTIAVEQTEDAYIKIHDCTLRINDQDEQYFVDQGIDIATNETMQIICDITNHSNSDIEYIPMITTYKNSIYSGNIVDTKKLEIEHLQKKVRKEVKFELPNPQKPGFYDSTLAFFVQDKNISNTQNIHFVVQGQSGSFGFITFDKSQYDQGDTINMHISIAGSADSFGQSRASQNTGQQLPKMTVKGSISSNEELCVVDIQKEVMMDSVVKDVDLSATTINDCSNPVAKFALYDENGNILDEREYSLSESANIEQSVQENKNYAQIFGIGIIILLSIIVVGIIIKMIVSRKKKDNNIGIFIFFLLCGGVVLFGVSDVQAGTTVQCGPNSMNNHGYCYTDVDTANCNKVKATGRISWVVCNNHVNRGFKIQWRETTSSEYKTLVNETQRYIDHCRKDSYVSSSYRCKPGSNGWTATNGSPCIKDSNCNKNYYGILNGHDLEGSHTATVSSGPHTGRFLFTFSDPMDDYSQTVAFNKAYTVAACPYCGDGSNNQNSEDCDWGVNNGNACALPGYSNPAGTCT